MDYRRRIKEGSGPSDFVRDSFISIHAWLSEQIVAPGEAEYLADMTRKVDWSEHAEKEDFLMLMDYFSRRYSLSSDVSWDMSWGEVVCCSAIAIGFSLLIFLGVIAFVFSESEHHASVHCSQF